MAILIDTSVLIDAERGRGVEDLEAMLGDEERALSVITMSELLHGVHRASPDRRAARRAFVEHIIARIPPLPITEAVARVHAEIWSALAERGALIGAHDCWIAATALAHGLAVATRNAREFERVPGLRVVPTA